jgi:glutathione S-transferase
MQELGCAYDVESKAPSYFLTTHNTLGPSVTDKDFLVLELDTILRYVAATHGPQLLGRTVRERAEVDQMLELHSRWWQAPLSRVSRLDIDPSARHSEISNMKRTLNRLEQRLSDREYLVGKFSVADCPAYLLTAAPTLGLNLALWPAVQAYVNRVADRPSYHQAQQRARQYGLPV